MHNKKWTGDLKMKVVSGIVFTLLLIGTLTLTFNIQPVKSEPTTIIVPDDYPTIQEAINAANEGDTIFVRNGTYYENVVVNKTVGLVGEDKYTTIIDGNSTGNVIVITSNNVNFTGFTIQYGDNGIYVGDGIFLGFCNIYENIVRNNTNGIYLSGSSRNNNASYNIITNNQHGIVLSYSGENTLLGNNATSNRYNFEVEGFSFFHLDNNVDTSNTVDGKPIYYLIAVSNVILGAESNAGTVFLINCQNITVKDLTLTKNGVGVFLWNTTNSKIENVTVTRSRYGVFLGDSCNNTLSTNTVANCTYGISLEASFWQSNNNTIIGNNVISNSRGIDLDTSNNNIIIENIVTDNSHGIYLWDSSNNILFDNIVSSSSKYGIELWAYTAGSYGNILSGNIVSSSGVDGIVLNGADNNTVSGNIISSNRQYGITLMADNNLIYGNTIANNSGSYWSSGIYFGWTCNNIISSNTIKNNSRGVFLYGEGENNKIFHNNFINNKDQVASSKEHLNTWDDGYPSGGNYWSNYNGTDQHWGSGQNKTGSDGIGDTPYVIDSNNIDRYPLIATITVFDAGVWNGTTYTVDVISNSTVSDFHFNPDEGPFLRFNVSGEGGTTGFCRLTIPYNVTAPPYTVKVNGTTIDFQTIYENQTEGVSIIYFTYQHSTLEITIIPEFPSSIALFGFLMLITIPLIFTKKTQQTRKANKRT